MAKKIPEKKILTKKQFERLSKKKKVLLVAQDVLDQLKTGKYYPSKGLYINFGWYATLTGDIKSNFEEMQTCNVCVMGACILSVTHFKNQLQFNDVGKTIEDMSDNVFTLLSDLFKGNQLLLIESAYEGYDSSSTRIGKQLGQTLSDKEIIACSKFFRRYNYNDEKFVAIMKNIIRNEGTFKP